MTDKPGRAPLQVLAAAGTSLAPPPGCYRHLGLYAYRREVLLACGSFAPNHTRAGGTTGTVAGARAWLPVTGRADNSESVGVDTPEDVPSR